MQTFNLNFFKYDTKAGKAHAKPVNGGTSQYIPILFLTCSLWLEVSSSPLHMKKLDCPFYEILLVSSYTKS